MKFTFLLSAIFFFNSTVIQSQNWLWSEKVNFDQKYLSLHDGMLFTSDGTVYHYGSKFLKPESINPPTDMSGSFLKAFAPGGTELLAKHWPGMFYIRSMVYDGSSSIYFTGLFRNLFHGSVRQW